MTSIIQPNSLDTIHARSLRVAASMEAVINAAIAGHVPAIDAARIGLAGMAAVAADGNALRSLRVDARLPAIPTVEA